MCIKKRNARGMTSAQRDKLDKGFWGLRVSALGNNNWQEDGKRFVNGGAGPSCEVVGFGKVNITFKM